MENQSLIYKIKSFYIIQQIFNFIKDNYFQKKLYIYSKWHQAKININPFYYKQKYYNKTGFDISKYLFKEKKKYDKDYLTKMYNKFILAKKLNKEDFDKLIFIIIENEKRKDIIEEKIIENNSQTLISIDSPLFETISKTKIFKTNYIIYISQKNIDNYNLIINYKNIFDKLNKSNIQYSAIIYNFNDKAKINYLKEMNIDFNKIKSLNLIQEEKDINILNDFNKENIKNFFELFFSFKNIKNNLIYLKIFFNAININNYLDGNLFENINNFKSLKYLYIKSFNFEKIFIIKLTNLKILSCENCKNIIISNNDDNKLEKLYLINNKINSIKIFENYHFNELKELILNNNMTFDIEKLDKVKLEKLEKLNLAENKIKFIDVLLLVNFPELKDLDLNNNNISDIKVLGYVQFEKLEKLNLGNNKIYCINILEFTNFKELKELNLCSNNIDNINVLEKVKFQKLEKLYLGDNKISNIDILKNVNFKELKELELNYNKISDIRVLEKVKFEKLEKIDLDSNEIDIKEYSSSIINNLKSKFKNIYF